MVDARAPSPPPGRLARLDARLKLFLLAAVCIACQCLPPVLLPAWLALLATLFLAREMRSVEVRTMLRAGLYFIGFWLLMTCGSDLLLDKGWRETLAAALPLGGRLLSLALVGMAFVGLSSPVETGLAAAWYAGPFLGKRAWKPVLAVVLVAWFLPLTLRVAGEVAAGLRARGLRPSWWRRAVLVFGASLRILERRADELAVGIASRRLDDWRSWRESGSIRNS